MKRKLPEQFFLSHNLCFAIHDLIADLVIQAEKRRLEFFKCEITRPEHVAVFETLKQEDFWDWANENGYRRVLDEFSYRQLVFALTSDLCQFVYEGLRCSEKGKLSVAFSNLRKPIQDNLFYLEWLLADRAEFLGLFRKGAEHIVLDKLGPDVRKAKRLAIIGEAIAKSIGDWIEPEWIYELRYEKNSAVSFDPTFNQAIHLVTTHKSYVTDAENINFIFCTDADRESLWRHLYLLLPKLLIHALYVVRALCESIDGNFTPHGPEISMWLMAGFNLHTESIATSDNPYNAATVFGESYNEVPLECSQCSTLLDLEKISLSNFWNFGVIECCNCKTQFEVLEIKHRFQPRP